MTSIIAFGHCACCNAPFGFHPDLVPSYDFGHGREPVCEPCMHVVNSRRVTQGLPPHLILSGAYEPASEVDYMHEMNRRYGAPEEGEAD